MSDDWQLISSAPHSREVILWLKADAGTEHPLGALVGTYVENDVFVGWTEKSVAGNMNAGLRQDLITHWKEVGDAPA